MSIRGLPDERPQQSVARLVARWDSHVKRQSTIGTAGNNPPGQNNNGASPVASPSQSRTASVVSHNTGDSALIESKERREWPPKPKIIDGAVSGNIIGNGETVQPTRSTSTSTFSVADLRRSLEKTAENGTTATHDVVGAGTTSPPQPPPSDIPSDGHEREASIPASVAEKPDSKESTSEPPPATSDASAGEEVKSDPAAAKKESHTTAPTARATGKITSSKSTPASRTSTATSFAKSTSTSRHSTTAQSKSSSSTPGAKAATHHAAKPLTAQRTGNSIAGAGAGLAAAAARAGMKSPPISSRAKTPTALRASTSGSQLKAPSQPLAARAKTPTPSPASRTKTPTASHPPKHTSSSSGLYAPTKASLARARNADAPPPPVPKATVTSSSLERLMRPTAASASKVREGPVSPPRAPAAKVATRGAAPSPARGKTLKPRVGHAPARMKAEREKKGNEDTTKEAVAATAQPAVPSEQITSEDESISIEQPSFASTTAQSDTSQDHEHEVSRESDHDHEDDHIGPPSDIESYDDAFASDDERALELDEAHLVSARPREEGEREPFASTPDLPDMTPQTASFSDIVPATPKEEEFEREDEDVVSSPHHAQAEVEAAEEKEVADPVAVPFPASEITTTEATSTHSAEETLIDTNTNGSATPGVEPKQNGVATSPAPETTEFDSVLDMLAVKPPVRTASPGIIPDDE